MFSSIFNEFVENNHPSDIFERNLLPQSLKDSKTYFSIKFLFQDLSERLTGKRKIVGGKVEAPIKRTKYPAYFISDLAHVVAFTDERIPFTSLASGSLKHFQKNKLTAKSIASHSKRQNLDSKNFLTGAFRNFLLPKN